MKQLTETNAKLLNLGILLLRCTLGAILFGAGAGKVFKWFGGFGLAMTMQGYRSMGIPDFLAYLSIYTELIGGLLLILGFLTRPVAFAVLINMIVATIVMLPKGFIIGMAAYPFSLMVSSLVLLLTGPMAYSIDSWLLQPGDVIRELRR